MEVSGSDVGVSFRYHDMDHDPATALVQAVQGCVSASADVRMHVLAKATPLVGELRSRNREAHEALADRQSHVQQSQRALDEAVLAYESLLYEHRELASQIASNMELERLDHRVLTHEDQTHLASLPASEQYEAERTRLHDILSERRQLELEGKKLAEEVAQLQKQSRLAHRHLVRLEQGIASLHQSVQRHAS